MEREFHRWLKTRITADDRIAIGIGDDGAVLASSASSDRIVVVTDAIAAGTHFDLEQHALERIGRKSLAVNLSDIAAMGARPVAALLMFQLPRSFSLDDAKTLFSGIESLAHELDTPIIGGDTNCWDGPLVLGATVIGRENSDAKTESIWTIDQAQPGDMIVATGSFGGSLLGKHLDFLPRVQTAQYVIEHFDIHAATDVSDSLSLDVSAMASASELGVELFSDDIPISGAADVLAKQDGRTALEHALTDGEDFELVFAVPPQEALRLSRESCSPVPFTLIGRFVASSGFWLRDREGKRTPYCPAGYSH